MEKKLVIELLERNGIGKIESAYIPEGFIEEVTQKIMTFSKHKHIMEWIKQRYRYHLSYSKIGMQFRETGGTVRSSLRSIDSHIKSYLVSPEFIDLLMKYHIDVSGSITADFLEKEKEKEKCYAAYQKISLHTLSLSEETCEKLYENGYCNMKLLLSENIFNFRNMKFINKMNYYELLTAISSFLHKNQPELKYREEVYPVNFFRESGIFLAGAFSDNAVQKTEEILMKKFPKTVTKRNIEILRLRYQQKMTLAKIGEMYHISRERVNQILAQQKILVWKLIDNEELLSLLNEEAQAGRIVIADKMIQKMISDLKQYNKKENLLINAPLSKANINSLQRAGYRTIEEVIKAGADNIQCVSGIGKTHFAEIAEVMVIFGADRNEWIPEKEAV